MATQIENDKRLVRRAHTDADLGEELRSSVAFEMAERRLASRNWFWSDDRQDFVLVSEARAD